MMADLQAEYHPFEIVKQEGLEQPVMIELEA